MIVKIERLDDFGRGIAYINNKITFIENALEDEIVEIKIVKEQIDLNCLLDDVYDSFKILVNTKKIKLEYKDRNDEEIYFQGDYERLNYILSKAVTIDISK